MLAVLAVALLGGCAGNRESQLVGQWKMDSSALTAQIPAGKTPQEKMRMEMAKKVFENVTLDLKEDKTFAMKMMMEFSGNWKLDDADNTVTLNMTKMAGVDASKMPNAQANKPMVLQIGADNKTLTMTPPGGATPNPAGAMKFVKQ